MFNVYLDDVRNGPTHDYEETHSQIANKEWVIVRRTEYIKELLKAGLINDLSLDHDLGNDDITGYQLALWMEEEKYWPKGIISVHSANPVGRVNIIAVLARNKK